MVVHNSSDGHIPAPEKRQGQEALDVSPMWKTPGSKGNRWERA